jgi:hypothetical protein
LEGFRRLNTFKAHSDKSNPDPLLNANSFPGLSERESVGRLVGMPDILQQNDGSFGVVSTDLPSLPGAFAEQIAAAMIAARVPIALGGAKMSRLESADGCVGLAELNPDWRVVACRDRVQSIVQRRGSQKASRRDDWRGRAYCRTSEALIRCTREYAGAVDPIAVAILAALPERIDRDHTIPSTESRQRATTIIIISSSSSDGCLLWG